MFKPTTIIEPFRVKVIEPLPVRTREQRAEALRKAKLNLFSVHADQVTIDLMTDSGTSAMSQEQWAAIMRGDESYAGARSFFRFSETVKQLTGMEHIIPVHQGRAAERILFTVLGGSGKVIPANTHFDTTRANVEASGAEALDLVIEEGKDPATEHPFKGNLDVDALTKVLSERSKDVPMVVMTVTNNSGGGQPVSLENMKQVREICDKFKVPLFLDCARFAENAWFIKLREEGQAHRTPKEISEEMFRLADGAWMSSKKDAFGNIGGFLSLKDDSVAGECRNMLILTEGFPTYGGLAGRDLEALSVGLQEVLEEDYLEYRIRSTEYVWRHLDEAGVPLLRPAGGHAVYLDAREFLPHVPPGELPGQSISVAMFLEGGVRACEIGTVMFGHTLPDGTQEAGPMDLVRLAIPRRVYTQSHMDYVIEAVSYVFERREQLGGLKIIDEPSALRHFTCGFEALGWDPFAK
ncbi:MAG: tryptophanase [Planctomycetes bacterium]|nr:tryptophanase [Planctomycetota bacterium]MCP4769885.1 tryptophanase [Planctomycetota bacterium]MCP4859725.1 tryptophanase [Planctomycetota bacterium]